MWDAQKLMAQSITVFAFMKAKPGRENELRAEMLNVVELTRKEAGCLQYDLHVQTDDATRFAYYETWDSEESLARHAQSEHMNAFREFRKDMLDGPISVQTFLRIA
jgi:quinol monooxygenase YgiN